MRRADRAAVRAHRRARSCFGEAGWLVDLQWEFRQVMQGGSCSCLMFTVLLYGFGDAPARHLCRGGVTLLVAAGARSSHGAVQLINDLRLSCGDRWSGWRPSDGASVRNTDGQNGDDRRRQAAYVAVKSSRPAGSGSRCGRPVWTLEQQAGRHLVWATDASTRCSAELA